MSIAANLLSLILGSRRVNIALALLVGGLACAAACHDATARDSRGAGSTLFHETKLPPSRWKQEYLAEVSAAMRVGEIGKTKVDYTFTYTLGYGEQRDRIVGCEVVVTIGVGLPQWDHYGTRANADREWDRFVANLERHERGHVDIATRLFAGAADRCLGKTPTECESALAEIIVREQVEQTAFDRETEHGLRTGALLAGGVDRRPH